MSGRRRCALLGCIVLLACDARAGVPQQRPATAPAPASTPRSAVAEPASAQAEPEAIPAAAEPAREPEPARELQLRLVNGGAALAAQSVPGAVGRRIAPLQETELWVDLEDGTRLAVAPRTELWTFAYDKSLLLVSGKLRVTRLPDAPRAGRSPARISTPAGAVEVAAGADFELRVGVEPVSGRRERGGRDARAAALTSPALRARTQLRLLRAAVTWLAPDGTGGLSEVTLSAGEKASLALPGLQVLTLAPGDARSSTQAERAFRAISPRVMTDDLDQTLEAAVAEHRALAERSHVLLAPVSPRHAAQTGAPLEPAAAPGVGDVSTRDYQRALVEHARRRHAHRRLLLLAAEQSALRALARCGQPAADDCDATRAWSQRLGAELSSVL